MSAAQSLSNTQTHSGGPSLDPRLGALNHRLELILGSRSTGNAIQFRGRGRSLEAIVYILQKYINGDDGENTVLWKWVEDLTSSAAHISPTRTLRENTTTVESSKALSKRRSTKRQGNARKPRKRLSEAKIKVAKARSAKRWPHDPSDLEDDDPNDIDEGRRTPDEFLDQLTISWHSKHARWCDGIGPEVQEEVQRRGASLSLVFKIQQRQDSDRAPTYTIIPPSPETLRQKEDRAKYIRKESRKLLSQHEHLTLSYDGGTTRGHESVYTIHTMIHSTCDALLMDGNEASEVSHTTEHICTVLDKTLKAVGQEKFVDMDSTVF
ncbi:hypothetical protein B0J17DRAFT_628537 [Rhizoctonia solani]|nr:hypothetical protein B0J17DRAFT_628537 [Rhizoctonia solani]